MFTLPFAFMTAPAGESFPCTIINGQTYYVSSNTTTDCNPITIDNGGNLTINNNNYLTQNNI